jgi:hypothetical protein
MLSKEKIAIVYSESISKAALGSTRTLLDLGNMLSKYYDIKFFSLGKYDRHVSISSGIKEEIFYSSASSDSRTTKSRILDYASLIFLNKQRSYQVMNNNKNIYEAVIKYNPDFIITLGRNLVDLVIELQKELTSTCTISITDDFRVVENSIKIQRERMTKNAKGPKLMIKLFFFDLISKRHLSFSLKIYKKMLKQLTATAFVTDIDKDLSIKRYPNLAKKFFVLPTASFPNYKILNKPKYPVKDKIKKIVFIGNCKHEPNLEAMSLIETEIAPKLKEKSFIIIGSGCEKKKIANVEYTGFISEEEKNERIDTADLCIAPLKNGSGIKVKILDYFARCKPVIGTSVAFEGYPIKNMQNAILEDNISHYAKHILALDSKKELREKISLNANTICNYFSYSETSSRWLKVLRSIKKNSNQL